MNRKLFEKPTIEFVETKNEDIITTSNNRFDPHNILGNSGADPWYGGGAA